ncbi:Uncharacterised protein [Mycobacterium tuberculosis]|nr:Uncharacterised protein [Mycobacterium tuberculosis]
MRSRVTPYTWPISSSVRGCPSVRPKRSRTTPASRSDSVSSTDCSWSCSSVNETASTATTASLSSMKSPSWLSPSSPMVWSSEIGSRAYCWISSTFSGVMSISLASSSGVGSRPRSCSSSRWMRPSLLITSTMCTGMRMVRAWSAMARVMA